MYVFCFIYRIATYMMDIGLPGEPFQVGFADKESEAFQQLSNRINPKVKII